jgi:hypothetical protein
LSHKGVNQPTRRSSSNTNSSNDAETQVPFGFLLSPASLIDVLALLASPGLELSEQGIAPELYGPLCNAHIDVTLISLDFLPLTWVFVEVTGFEPASSTLRKYGSRRSDQGLSKEEAVRSDKSPSGSLINPPVPSR